MTWAGLGPVTPCRGAAWDERSDGSAAIGAVRMGRRGGGGSGARWPGRQREPSEAGPHEGGEDVARDPDEARARVVDDPPELREDPEAQALGPSLAQVGVEGHRLEQLEQVEGQHLEPQPGGVGAVLRAGIDPRGQLVLEDPVDVLDGALLAAVPGDELATGGRPVVGHDREVAHLGPVPEEGALGWPHPDGEVAVGLRVLLLVATRGHEGHLGPLAHEAVGLDLGTVQASSGRATTSARSSRLMSALTAKRQPRPAQWSSRSPW